MKNILFVYEEDLYADGLEYLLHSITPNISIDKCKIYDDVDSFTKDKAYDFIFMAKTSFFNPDVQLKMLRSRNPKSKIILVTKEPTIRDTRLYAKYNLNAIICRKFSKDRIEGIIDLLFAGEDYIPSETFKKSRLMTLRQLSILDYMKNGYSNKQIAYELGVSESTIKTTISAVIRKLHCTNRLQAVNKAIQDGLISY